MERILKPDMELENHSFERSFSGTSYKGMGEARVKEFRYVDKFTARSASTRSFSGPESHWNGKLKFGTKDSALSDRKAETKEFRVKSVDVEDARESGRAYETRDFAGQREASTGAKSQDALDQQHENPEPMSIDQVRDLLNKTQ